MKTITIFLSIVSLTIAKELFAQQPGDLDVTFGTGGKVITSIGPGDEQARSVFIQPDGKIVVVGFSDNGTNDDFAITRYNSNGSLDNTFGSGGKLSSDFFTFDNVAYSAIVQPDGKIVVAGYAKGSVVDYAVARFSANGVLDANFGTNGITTLDNDLTGTGSQSIKCLAIQTDLKILAAGEFWQNGSGWQIAVVRYNTDGTLDNSFGTNGRTITTAQFEQEGAYSIAIQSDGKILVAGYWFDNFPAYAFILVRLNSDGSLDNSFGTNGKVITDIDSGQDEAYSVLIQPDEKIVVAGISSNDTTFSNIALVRYNSDGTLDNSFGTGGKVTTDFGKGYEAAYAAALQPDGKIVAVGYSATDITYPNFAVVRYNSAGTLDSSFGINGKIITEMAAGDDQAYSVAIQPDGKIVAAGFSSGSNDDFAIARYLSGLNVGILEFSPVDNVLIYPNPVHDNEVLEYALQQTEVLTISLYDVSGKLVKQFVSQESRSTGVHKEPLNLSEIISGSYILTIENGSGRTGIKVMKE